MHVCPGKGWGEWTISQCIIITWLAWEGFRGEWMITGG